MQAKPRRQLRAILFLPFLFCTLAPTPALATEAPLEVEKCTLLSRTQSPQEADELNFEIAPQGNADLHLMAVAAYMKEHFLKSPPKRKPPSREELCLPKKFFTHSFSNLNLDSPESLHTELQKYFPTQAKPGAKVSVTLDAMPALPVRDAFWGFTSAFRSLADTREDKPARNQEEIAARDQAFHNDFMSLADNLFDSSYYIAFRQRALREAGKELFKGDWFQLSAKGVAGIQRAVGAMNSIAKLSKDMSPPDLMVFALPEDLAGLTPHEVEQFKFYNEELTKALEDTVQGLRQTNSPIGGLDIVREDMPLEGGVV